jgi:hypothetical protein
MTLSGSKLLNEWLMPRWRSQKSVSSIFMQSKKDTPTAGISGCPLEAGKRVSMEKALKVSLVGIYWKLISGEKQHHFPC